MLSTPSRLSVVLGTTLAGLLVVSQEVNLSHPLQVALAAAIGGMLYLVHPAEAGVLMVKPDETAPPYTTGVPAPATEAAPAPAQAPEPPEQSLP